MINYTLHPTVHHTAFILGSSFYKQCFKLCIGPQTLLTRFNIGNAQQLHMKPELSVPRAGLWLVLSIRTETSHYVLRKHRTMENQENPLILLYALFPLSGVLVALDTRSLCLTTIPWREQTEIKKRVMQENELKWLGDVGVYTQREWLNSVRRKVGCVGAAEARGKGRWEETGGCKVTSCACLPSGHTYGCYADGIQYAQYMSSFREGLPVNKMIRLLKLTEPTIWGILTGSVGECFCAGDSEGFFADYDMTERETRSRQTRTWCFSAWLESSATPFVFIHTVDRSSLQLCLPFLLPPLSFSNVFQFMWLLQLVCNARGKWERLQSVSLTHQCAQFDLYAHCTCYV